MKTRPKDPDEHYDRREKSHDEIFCWSCGSVVKINDNLCPKCGVVLRATVKERETAIFLSLFTSFFVWLYLYEKSSIKFWIGFSVTFIFLVITRILYLWGNTMWYLALVPIIVVWLFAVVDTLTKESKYFSTFGG